MSGCRIFIGRLSPSAREKDVERFFKGYGRIRDIDLKKGFGFVVSQLHGKRNGYFVVVVFLSCDNITGLCYLLFKLGL